MRKLWLAPLVMAGALLFGGMATPAAPVTANQGIIISMNSDLFVPDVIVVQVGTTVTWTNDEPDPTNGHNVISTRGSVLNSPIFYAGGSWSFTFDATGEYTYYCDLHEGMVGVVVVQ